MKQDTALDEQLNEALSGREGAGLTNRMMTVEPPSPVQPPSTLSGRPEEEDDCENHDLNVSIG